MPELPEVETIACGLAPQVEGLTITAVTILNDTSVDGDRAALEYGVVNAAITRVHRRGKLLLMDIEQPQQASSGPDMIGVHLKMSGRLFVYSSEMQPEKHTRIIFDLSDGSRLFFDDMRKFGYCRAISDKDREQWKFWNTLGPEPLEIDAEAFVTLLHNRRTRIKAALLDQAIIAGIGNIYADESLYSAGIRPDTCCNTIPVAKLEKLHTELQRILRLAIRECGSSIRNYRDAKGDAGSFQNNFAVYGRSGQACFSCNSLLKKTVVAGRTTVYCPKCQR